MKSFKPEKRFEELLDVAPGNTHDLFISLEFLENYIMTAKAKSSERLASRLGINVFVFDIDSCEFFEK